MYAVLGESDADVKVLQRLLQRHIGAPAVRVATRGYGGCTTLRARCHRDIRALASLGTQWFVICHDADNKDPSEVRTLVQEAVYGAIGTISQKCFIAVPVQEMEAWLIADEKSIQQIVPGAVFKQENEPEKITSPKDWLISKSRDSDGIAQYQPSMHNERVASLLDLDRVARKCPSFKALCQWLDSTRTIGL